MKLEEILSSAFVIWVSEASLSFRSPPVSGVSCMILDICWIETVANMEMRSNILVESNRWLAPSSPDVVDVSPNFFDDLQTAQMRSSIVVNESYNIMG